MSNKNGNQNAPTDEEAAFSDFKTVKRQNSFVAALKFLPFGFVTSTIGVLLFVTVRGLDLKNDIPFIAIGYVLGAIGLSVAYHFVSKWVKKQRSIQVKGSYEGSEGLWFSLFYNNAFYVFLLLFFSQIAFSSLPATTSLVLTQLAASFIPAWISSFSNN